MRVRRVSVGVFTLRVCTYVVSGTGMLRWKNCGLLFCFFVIARGRGQGMDQTDRQS